MKMTGTKKLATKNKNEIFAAGLGIDEVEQGNQALASGNHGALEDQAAASDQGTSDDQATPNDQKIRSEDKASKLKYCEKKVAEKLVDRLVNEGLIY